MPEYVRMDKYCSSVRDGTHDTPKPTEDGFYLVTSKAINNDAIDFSGCYYISAKDYNKINERSKVDKWDVIMTMIGTVGRLHLVQDDPSYAIKNIALFKVGEESRAKWLYYYLSTPAVQNYFELIASGTSQHFIGLGDLRKFKIEDFRKDSKRITEILSSYDDLIEVNNKRIKVLEQMAENLYKEWFVRFRFPDHESVPFENDLPKGWKYVKFADVFDYVRGISYSSEEIDCDEGENLINLKNIQGYGGFRQEGTKRYNGQCKPEQVVHYKDLVMGVTDMTQDRRTVGAVALIPSMSGIISADLIKLLSPLDNVFSYCLFRWGYYSTYISQFGNGANVIHLKPSSIKNAKILIPSEPLVDAFSRLVNPMIDQIDALSRSVDALIKQRDLLLPRLMSGKLEV